MEDVGCLEQFLNY